MSALPPHKANRRKGPTPRTKRNQEDVWVRTFQIMGLEPLSSNKATDMAKANTITITHDRPPTPTLAQRSDKKKISILDLPSETQKDIFKYSNSPDLIALSLVSKHFREIAAAQLYRSFHIVFPDEEDPSNDSPIDGLAGGLDTFVTSDYDYATYLREIILETLSGGDKGERAYRHYLYDMSCGKFMNTLLLLSLRKAKALETFKWDIRVELSRQVFKALHEIGALQHLHLRMQAGHSIYQTPPDIPSFSAIAAPVGMLAPPPHPNNPPFLPLPPGYSVGNSSNSFSLGSKISSKAHQKSLKSLLPAFQRTPPTLSGFKDLKTLAILDMDTLDYIAEIAACIKNSSSTLNTLKLSFSEALANKSRKPPPEVHSDDDSDQEDEFGQLIPPPGPPPGNSTSGAADPNGPSKVLKAQEEKKKQEAALGKIFGLETAALKPKLLPKVENEPEPRSHEDYRKNFIRNLQVVAKKLFSTVKDGKDLELEATETLDLITKAAKLYLEGDEKSRGGEKTSQAGSAGSSTAKATPASSSVSADDRVESDLLMTGAAEPGLFDEPTSKKKEPSVDSDVINPDDINVEEPEGQELALDSDQTLAETQNDSMDDAKLDPEAGPSTSTFDVLKSASGLQISETGLTSHGTQLEMEEESQRLKAVFGAFQTKLSSGTTLEQSDYDEFAKAKSDKEIVASRTQQILGDEADDIGGHIKPGAAADEGSLMSDYVRTTRGLTLTTLAIYLIPIKASVLSRAIDLTVLQSITLLNVGPQISFWNATARENKLSPLPLRKIHTDNVTLPFLAFVSQLDTVTELILLERTQKARVESTTSKTTVTMEQIRRGVLKKHAATLKILMIRNDAGSEWDLNVKTTMLLCQRAKLLEELAVSFGIRTMHTLLQFIPGLSSLRALYTIQFRTDDTCMWVMREFRKFTVDNVSHNPDMKLEYLALETSVERLVRRTPLPKPPKFDKKGKGKEVGSSKNKALAEMVLGSSGLWPDGTPMGGSSSGLGSGGILDAPPSWEDSEDEESGWGYSGLGVTGKVGLKVETVEGIRFCDVTGVRIFEKDVLSGRL